MCVPIKSPHARLSLVKTGDSIAAGRKMALEAKSWMERNKDAFFEIYGFVKSLQSQEKVGRVRDRVAVFCMERGINVLDEPYKFANAKWAGIARYLALYDPSLMDAPLKFADSDIDCYGLMPVSYLPDLGKDGQ
jgi:hypothetical protein